MKKFCATTVLLLMFTTFIFSQNLTQTVRGTLIDEDSKMPLIGANVILLDSNPIKGVTTDDNGNFKLDNIPIGRIALKLSYIGYENAIIPNIVVNSGKEVVLNLTMRESAVKMDAVVVTVDKNKGEALNDMAILSARSISPEETSRYAGGFNDPSRIVSNFAGVTNTQDGSNDIIVRGNSPKYVQWRLEGEQITNPNHFADQSSAGGSVSTLNNNILATSDFYTGAFTPEYGDALSGVYDVKLRAGNNEKLEAVFGFGLLGTDLTIEGPLKKGYDGSFLVNYRYSTVSLLKDIGLADINGVLKFQDAAFKVLLPIKKMGIFSIYGLGGKSSFLLDNVTPTLWSTPGDRFMQADIKENFEKKSHLLNTGITHTLSLNERSYIKTALTYSNEGIDDDVFEEKFIKIFDTKGDFLRDSVVNKNLNFSGRLSKPTYRGSITYNNKINAKHKIQVGTKYTLFDFDFNQSQLENNTTNRFTLINFKENISTIRNFVSWKYRINEALTMVSGFHNMNVLYNKKSTFEPRLAINWQLNNASSINVGYGNHSTMEAVHHYFAKIKQPNGTVTEPNKDLDLLKAHHFVVGFEKRLGKNMRAKIEAYYQDLYNLPVENNDTSYFATINEGLEFRYVDLVNKGTGKNYGIELTIEKFLSNNYYYMVNASIYESKYKSLEGIERNTQYNGKYLVNVLFGKEFVNLGKKKNQMLGLNFKAFAGGGKKIIPLLRNAQGKVAVDPANNRYWDYKKAYENDIEDVYQINVSASYKWNKRKTTHELFLNIDNITNTKGRITEFYDADKPNGIGNMTQFGAFPNLMYRVYF
jgi:CarboxypepD_reg-like domain